MATLHDHKVDTKKVSITPGSYIALWSEELDDTMPENEQRIFGRGGFHPTRQSPPVLLYTPDGVTLQSRYSHTAYGTLTQYERFEGEYQWLYTSYSNPQSVVMRPRVWIIDPMPEADALALARAAYKAETAAGRFNAWQAFRYSSPLLQVIANASAEVREAVEAAVRELFINAHVHHAYGAEREGVWSDYCAALAPVEALLEGAVDREYDKAISGLDTLPMVRSLTDIQQMLRAEAPMLSRYFTVTGTSTRSVERQLRRAAHEAKYAPGTNAIFLCKPAPTIY